MGEVMEIQFITDASGNRTAAIVPFEEWERMEEAKELLEHIYLSEIIKNRQNKHPGISSEDLLNTEGLTRADLES